jgi:hypothetical protein
MQDRRPASENPQNEDRRGQPGVSNFRPFSKGLLYAEVRARHAAAVEPGRNLSDEAQRCIFIERMREGLERCPRVRRRISCMGVLALRALPPDVGARTAHRLELASDRVDRPHPPRVRVVGMDELPHQPVPAGLRSNGSGQGEVEGDRGGWVC